MMKKRKWLRVLLVATVTLASLGLVLPEAQADTCVSTTTSNGDITIVRFTTNSATETCYQTWKAPANIKSVSILVVGGGGGGGYDAGGGGGGGGSAYSTRATVTPSNSYLIKVGRAGSGGTSASTSGSSGESSEALSHIGNGGSGGGGCNWNGSNCQAGNVKGTGGSGSGGATNTTGSNGGNGYCYSSTGSGCAGASSAANGGSGTTTSFGAFSVVAGAGGNGGGGVPGNTPTASTGSGGGGGSSHSSGITGAAGTVVITYLTNICAPTQTAPTSTTTRIVFTAAGRCIWQVPIGVTNISVEVVGGGGGGGYDSGGGGGGGGYGYSPNVTVTPGETSTMIIGSGGTGGISTRKYGIDGTASTFRGITANGGAGGNGCNFNGTTCASSNTGGAGGSATGATTNNTGKTGGTGYCATSCSVLSAGSAIAGTQSSLDTSTIYGASGAGGYNVSASDAANGFGTGGAGGAGNSNGGAGGNGRVVIQFTVSNCTPTSYISNDGNKRILRFTNTEECFWTVPSTVDSVTVLVVGGGGGGGFDGGGGGGGGGVIFRNTFTTTPQSKILVRIGKGGTGAQSGAISNDADTANSGLNGEQTVFSSLVAPGGGGGGGKNAAGQNGASGGGAGHAASPYPVGGSGTFIADVPTPPASAFGGATSNNGDRGTGGGGATAAGASGGAGGAGFTSSISETSTVYGGGGGGGTWSSATASLGGCGTGGAGGTNAANATNGATNTGCGGGGTGHAGNYPQSGRGADGVVFVTFPMRTQIFTLPAQLPSNRAWNNAYSTVLKAASNKGDTITATSSTTSICTVDANGNLSMLTPGTCTIVFSDPGDVVYKSASQSYSFQVLKATPTFGSWILAGRNYSNTTFNIDTPTITSASPGTFTLTSETTSVLTISGTTGTTVGVGTSNVRAAFTPTNTTLWETATLTTALVVSRSNRTINFSTTTLSKTYGDDTFTVTAVASIGAGDGTITYSKTGSACSVTSSGTVTILAAGSCSLFATISTGVNYDNATTSIPVAVTIGRKALSISGSRVASKVYDGTRTPGTLTVGTLSGLVSGESLTVTGSLSLMNSANADTYTVTATYTLGDGTNGLAANYSLATESLQAVVTKKALTVTASSPTVAYGDSKPSISYEYSGFAGSENATFISQAPTCDTVYTTTSNYGSSPSTSCSGAVATNYTFTYVSGSVTITRVNLTVTASSHTLNYGDAVPTFTYTITGFKNSQTSSVLSTLPTCTTTDYTNTSPRGTYYSRCSGAAATNYTFTYADGVITVNIVTRSVSLSVGSTTLTYGDSTTATFSMTGNQSDGTLSLSVFSGPCQISGGRILATAGIDSCVIRATASGATSYSDTYTAVTITLAKKALSVSGTTIASRAYNGTNTRGSITVGTVTGYVGSDNLTVNAAALDYSGSNVGTYSVTVQYTLVSTAQGTSSNYSLANQSISGQITAKALTVTAPSLSRHFSQALPASLNPTITGFVNSETTSVLSTIPTCTTTYTTSSTVGSSQSTSCSGGVATNYTFTYVSGVVTVTTLVRTIDVTADKTTLVYGESASLTVNISIGSSDGALNVSITGNGCAFGVDSSTVTAVDPNGTCTINASITGGLNYNDAVATPLAITLTKKSLTISGLRTTAKTYDGSLIAPVSGGTLVGLINSDSVTVTTAVRFADKSVGRNKPVTSISSISGSAASKYNLVQPALPSETITAATVTVSGLTVRSRPANGTRVATVDGTPVLSGIVNGDSVSLINFSVGTFETSTVGDSRTVTIEMSLSGTDSNNYILTIPTYRADITIAYDNTITFASLPDLPIGSSPFVLVASTTSGLQISFAASGSACSLSGETVTISALGSCSITASQAGNVSTGGTVPAATPITRTFTVTTRSITITADDKTFNVGGRANPTYKISGGLISGDRISSVTIRYSGDGLNNSINAPTTSGNYSINLSSAVFANSARASLYTITYVSGTLVIFETTPKDLTSLKVLSSGASTNDLLQGGFSNSTTSYSLRVDYAVSSVLITMARANSTNVNAQVRVNESGWRTLKWSAIVGGTTDSGVLPLPAATNTIAVRLYGSDKEIDTQSRVITILIYRDQASRPVANPADTSTAVATFTDRVNESTIPAAAAVSAVTFTPNINFGLFNPNVDSYTATVAKKISAVTVNTNFTGNGITVKISVNNGPQKAIPQTGKSETYALIVGTNTVTIRALSPDGSMQQYLFTITRSSS